MEQQDKKHIVDSSEAHQVWMHIYQHRVTVLPFHCILCPLINYDLPVTLNVTIVRDTGNL